MAKPALGRGLGHLMNGDAVAGQQPGEKKADPKLSRGFTTLVEQEKKVAAPPEEGEERRFPLPAWFFFAADLLLLGFTVAVVFNAPKPLGWGDVLFCSIITGVAGVFGIAGVLLSRHEGS